METAHLPRIVDVMSVPPLVDAIVKPLLTAREVDEMFRHLSMHEYDKESLTRFRVKSRVYYIAEDVVKANWGFEIVAPTYPIPLLSTREYEILGFDFGRLCAGLWDCALPIYSRCGWLYVDPHDIQELTITYET